MPGEPVSPGDKRVLELNEIASAVMAKHNVPVVDLYKAMRECGEPCYPCKPHCGAAGYQYLASHAFPFVSVRCNAWQFQNPLLLLIDRAVQCLHGAVAVWPVCVRACKN